LVKESSCCKASYDDLVVDAEKRVLLPEATGEAVEVGGVGEGGVGDGGVGDGGVGAGGVGEGGGASGSGKH